jgi:hypothetical protein
LAFGFRLAQALGFRPSAESREPKAESRQLAESRTPKAESRHPAECLSVSAFLHYLLAIVRGLLALPVSLLPRRFWQRDVVEQLPLQRAVPVSGFLTALAGLAFGTRWYLAFMRRMADLAVDAAFRYSAAQMRHEVRDVRELTTWDLQSFSLVWVLTFLVTPAGLFAVYMVVGGAVRGFSALFDQPFGDPLLTGADALARRVLAGGRTRRAEAAREAAEGPEVPDRLFTGDWVGLGGVDYVVVASRRKPDWTRGTFVITSEKRYTLGEPFDMQLPQGLRTVYPLTEQKVTEVLRRGVPYELPALSRGHGRGSRTKVANDG